ncbi:MAG TPA: class I SAM-dependent methyltransferase [Flavobacterium sp.]|nr:class I SAM-dependent methyltransferase [Flavobacterium sp.]
MSLKILNHEIQEFINANINCDIASLALKNNPFPEVDFADILNQIAAKTKASRKLPTWFNTKNIIYPPKVSIEQASSERTAAYKSEIVSGENLIDLTGGFGIDSYYFSKKMGIVVHCEMNPELSSAVKHNFRQLNVSNVRFYTGDSFETLQNFNIVFDWLYADPSRRNDAKGKVFMLQDCLPNFPALLPAYFKHSKKILLKTAPILDISAGLSELKNVKKIHVVAVENEVKELLWELEKEYAGDIQIKTANISKNGNEEFEFDLNGIYRASYSLPKQYLYEPNSAIMKSGAFDAVSHIFNLGKLHANSHLYTSDSIIKFPGRIFKIERIADYGKPEMKALLQNKKANIATRNFPEKVENIRKKWKIADGGDCYSFFTTDLNSAKIVLLCTKIK